MKKKMNMKKNNINADSLFNNYIYGSRSAAGEVLFAGDGIARISHLCDVKAGKMVDFPRSGIKGMVLNLEKDSVWFSCDVIMVK
jgi:F0F1-type ATP synthase alpha subunit